MAAQSHGNSENSHSAFLSSSRSVFFLQLHNLSRSRFIRRQDATIVNEKRRDEKGERKREHNEQAEKRGRNELGRQRNRRREREGEGEEGREREGGGAEGKRNRGIKIEGEIVEKRRIRKMGKVEKEKENNGDIISRGEEEEREIRGIRGRVIKGGWKQ